jgi:MFS family permease
MLGAIGLGAATGAFIIGRTPGYYPRHHMIPLAMCAFCVFSLAYSFSDTIWLSLLLLYGCGIAFMLTMNNTNTANQLLATDENRGRVVSVMLLCNQGALPMGHLFAGALAHVLSPQDIVRVMIGTLLVFAVCFLLFREPAIDGLARRSLKRNTVIQTLAEAITAESHRPPDATDEKS